MRRNAPWIAGLATFLVAGLGFAAMTGGGAIVAAVVGVLAGGAAGAGVRFAFPPDPELDSYQADARRRVAKVLESVRRIEKMSASVDDVTSRRALESGCARIPELLASVQARDPSGVASTAAKLNVTTSGIQTTLAQYLEIQKDPDLFTGAQELLLKGQQGFANFDRFVVDTFRALNDAEVRNYKATLAALEPFQIRQLTT
jgi:hypothetical protein